MLIRSLFIRKCATIRENDLADELSCRRKLYLSKCIISYSNRKVNKKTPHLKMKCGEKYYIRGLFLICLIVFATNPMVKMKLNVAITMEKIPIPILLC